jgi:hypothetical protein
MKPLSHLIKKSGLIVTTLACLCTASAEPLRFVSWNAQSFTNVADRSSTIEARINSAGFHLKSQNPDVVFLQGLPDWNSAQELSKQLGAEFRVVVCSTFAGSSSGEVAILSKLESGLGWPLSWDVVDGTTPSGGVAYATLRSGDQWIAVHSVDFPDTVTAKSEREGAMRQLLASIAGTMEWRTNRPSAFLVGGTLNTDVEESARSGEATLELTSDAGFTSAFLELSKPERMTLRGRTEYAATTADYIFADAGGFLTAAEVFPSIISDHAMISVEWDIDATMPVPQPLISLADTSNQLFGVELRWWVAGLGLFVVLMMLILLFRRPQLAFDPAHALPSSSGENILFLKEDETDAKSQTDGDPLLTNKERKKLRPHMLSWLKEHFVGSLVSQRQEMMNAQRSAAEQADALGKRVEKMQGLLLTRIGTAEGRVSELESELSLAKSENRELIQANLLLAQRELEEARRKMQAAQG